MKAAKKQLAILIALAMLVSLMPVTAFADGDDNGYANGEIISGTLSSPIDDDLLRDDEPDDEDIGERTEDAAEEVAISPAYMDFAPFAGPIPDLSDFDITTGAPYDVSWLPIPNFTIPLRPGEPGYPGTRQLKPGEIWADKSIEYPEISPGEPRGTVVITIYLWGRPYEISHNGIPTGELVLLGGDREIEISTTIGDFSLYESEYFPDGTGIVSTEVGDTLHWTVPEGLIMNPDEPLRIQYHLYLEDRLDWQLNYMYSTKDSNIIIDFEPNSENLFYWTTEEVTQFAFEALSMSWNAGKWGLNSAVIYDRELGITINFGANKTLEDMRVIDYPWSNLTYRNSYWNYTATVTTFGPSGGTTTYWWFLDWERAERYVFTVHNLTIDVDGLPIDVSYEIKVGGPGGNEVIPGSRTITSEYTFRRTFEEGNPQNRFPWNEYGHLVYKLDTFASIILAKDFILDVNEMSITKALDGWEDVDWNVDDDTLFHARLRIMNEDFYLILIDQGNNEFLFDSFTSRVDLATTITFSVNDPATIVGLPMYMDAIYPGDDTPIIYSVYEFFAEFFEEFFADVHDAQLIKDATALAYELIRITYSLDNDLPFTSNQPEFDLLTERTVDIENYFYHGIGFLEIHKTLDGFPNDWGITDDTVFYVRIYDVYAGNYLLFDPDRVFEPDSPFYGTIWCIGNHEIGLSEEYYVGRVMMEIPVSRNNPVRLSNLWTWGNYQVIEVRRAGTQLPHETEDPMLDSAWIDFWENDAERTPFWARPAADWALSYQWLQDRIDNEWEEVRVIEDEILWDTESGWIWGAIYSEHDKDLTFNETIRVALTNRFKQPTGNMIISKELAGHYASWGVDEDTLFWAGVYNDGKRLGFYNPGPNIYVFDGYLGRDAFIGVTPGTPTDEVSFSVLQPAIVIGLTTSLYIDPDTHPYEVVELRVNVARFTPSMGEGVKRVEDNLFVTITNTFVQRPGGNGGGGGTPPPDEKEPEQRRPSDFFVDEHIWYIRGYEDTTIRPNNNITRAEVAMAFYRLLRPELKNINPSSPFSDVRDDAWYGRGVSILAFHEIFTGYEDGTFRPNAPITRRELAAVVSRFDELIDTNVNPYRDVYQNDWARRYILSATQKGWFIGYDGLFRPGDRLTRAEFVTAVNRVLVRHILLEDVPADVFNFPDLNSSHWAYTAFMEAAHTHEYIRREDGKNEIWTEILGTGLDAAYNE